MTSAAAVVIGDEILSGKVVDTNTGFVIHHLRARGVVLGRVAIIADEVQEIAAEVRACSERYDWVFTSGGVGPTHDDRTMEGVALAFDRALVRPPELEQAVREHMGARMNDAALKLAEVPDGARLLDPGPFPLVLFRNIYILPGVPRIFEDKLRRICAHFDGQPPTVRRIFLQTHESGVADALREVAEAHSAVKIGSYPQFDELDHNLLVTVESSDARAVDRASDELLQRLSAERIVRIDGA